MDDSNETSESVAFHDSTGKRKSFARLCERFTDKTSLSGIPYIKNAKLRTAKVVWSVLLFLAMVAMVVHLWFLIGQYLQWPVVTKVKLDFATLPFPAITICNTNMMHKERLANYPGAKEMKTLIEKLDPVAEAKRELDALNYTTPAPPITTTDSFPYKGWSGSRFRFVDRKRRKRASLVNDGNDSGDMASNTNIHQDEFVAEKDRHSQLILAVREKYMDMSQANRLELGHHMSDMMLKCVYNSQVCSSRIFSLHQSSYYGNCWTMDDKIFKVFNAGPQGGLSIILYLESTEYIPGLNQGYGAKLHVHEPNTFSFPNDEGIFIPASMETDIGLRQTSITRKPDPYGTCKDSSDFLKKFGRKFSRKSCQAICKVEYMMEKCGCLSIDLEEVAEAAFPNATLWCRGTNKKCHDDVELKFKREKVDCGCDDPCEEVRYDKTISERQWPMEDYAMVLFAGVCKMNITVCTKLHRYLDEHGKFKNNFLKLNIFYEQLNFQTYTEEAEIENQQFASDVGGAIGLWIGLSMLSLCEIVQLVFELCDYAVYIIGIKRGNYTLRRTSRKVKSTGQDIELGKINRLGTRKVRNPGGCSSPEQDYSGPDRDYSSVDPELSGPDFDYSDSSLDNIGPGPEYHGPSQEYGDSDMETCTACGPGMNNIDPGHDYSGPGRIDKDPSQDYGDSDSGPGQVDSGPGHVNSGPGQVNSGPGQVNSGPGQVYSGPGQVNSGPGQVNGSPGHVDIGPGQVDSGPGQVNSGPGQVNSGPGQVNSGSSRIHSRPVPDFSSPINYRKRRTRPSVSTSSFSNSGDYYSIYYGKQGTQKPP